MDPLKQRQLQQLNQQQRALSQAPELVYRIGDRDPVTGKYTMIFPDGSKATGAEKLYSAESQPGDRVLAQQRTDGTWLLSEASPNARRRSSTPDPLPSRAPKRSRVYVLYELDGGLWIGGHKAVPERIADRPADLRGAWIWGDLQGWEVSLTRNPATPNTPANITAISSRAGRVDIDSPAADFYPLGAGYWEVLNKNKIFTPSDNPTGQAGLPVPLVWTFSCEAGYWSAATGYVLGSRTYSTNEVRTPVPWSPIIFEQTRDDSGSTQCPSPPTGKVLRSNQSLSFFSRPSRTGPTVAALTQSSDSTRVWMCDRISSLSIQGVKSATLAGDNPDSVSVYREFEGQSSKIGPTFVGTTQQIANPFGIPGSARLHEAMFVTDWRGQNGMFVYRVVAPTGGGYTPQGSTPTNPAQKEYWYTNGKMTAVVLAEIEQLRVGPGNISVAEVDVAGAETSFDVFAYAIPSAALLYSYCGCLV